MRQATSATAPITSSERIGELDVLRGFALFGVFVVHFVSSLYYLHPVDEAVFAAWTEDAFQYAMLVVCDVLFFDKAVTLFSVLFGIGFWVQMERFAAKGEGFERIYLRRLVVLLLIGLINKFLLFPGDILFDYALLGFVLFYVRKMPARTMLIVGLVLIFIVSQFAYGFLNAPWVDSEALDQALSDALMSNTYGEWVLAVSRWHIADTIVSLGLLPLGLYILGRFLVGAWIARQSLIEKARAARPVVARIAALSIAIGLICEGLTIAIWEDVLKLHDFFDFAFHAIGVPLLALGYGCVLILLCGSSRWNWLTGLFAPVGRMALTAYIGHGLLLLAFAHPFGIYIRPAVSPAAGWLAAIGVFLSMSLFCRLWLQHFRFGPLEWLWRSLTYGESQPFRKAA